MSDEIPDFSNPEKNTTVTSHPERRVVRRRILSGDSSRSVSVSSTPEKSEPQPQTPTQTPIRRRTGNVSSAPSDGVGETTLTVLPIVETLDPDDDRKALLTPMISAQFLIHDENGNLRERFEYDNEVDIANFVIYQLGNFKHRLISYGGRSLFLPRIRLIAMREGINASSYFSSGNKWDGYEKRFSTLFHVDLMEFINMDGATRSLTLEEALTFVGIDNANDVMSVYSLFQKYKAIK